MSGLLTAPAERKHLEASEVPEYLPRRVVSRCSGDAAAGVRARSAEIQAAHGRTVVGVAEHRARREELVEEARDMFSRRCETRINGAWNQHLDDGLARETGGARVEVGALHVAKR